MSDFDDAFAELYEAAAEAGSADTVNIDGSDLNAIVQILDEEEIYIAGGTAEAGGCRAMISKLLLPTEPAKYTPATFRGAALQVLNSKTNDCYIEVTIGDPASPS